MSKTVARAIHLGYVIPGWTIMDYIRDAIDNYGWECDILWGPKGGFKSNFLLQLGYCVYQDWNITLEHIIFEPKDFIRITKGQGRIPWLGWDDISAHLPRTLYMTNRALWDAVARNWDLFRPKLNVFCCTAPLKSRVASFILNDMSSELIVSKRHLYEHQRWMFDLDFKRHDSVRGIPIMIEQPTKINRDNVPFDVFNEYWKRRLKLTEQAHEDLISLFEKIDEESKVKKEKPEELPREFSEYSPQQLKIFAGRVLSGRYNLDALKAKLVDCTLRKAPGKDKFQKIVDGEAEKRATEET